MEKSQKICCLPEEVSINSETFYVMTVTGDCCHLGCDAVCLWPSLLKFSLW